MARRKIITIDEQTCTGCGLCIPNCPEGAIRIIGGKARLVSDVLCDGLGACLGHCPEGAITIEEREAEAFDEKKVRERIESVHTCPGAAMMDGTKKTARARGEDRSPSQLGHWPVQIMLVPPAAPYLNNADILVAADCVPFVYADFHRDFLAGKVLLVGCPKLDDIGFYKEKFCQILKQNNVRSITNVRMEVPCCSGLSTIVQSAIAGSSKDIPFDDVTITIKGERKEN